MEVIPQDLDLDRLVGKHQAWHDASAVLNLQMSRRGVADVEGYPAQEPPPSPAGGGGGWFEEADRCDEDADTCPSAPFPPSLPSLPDHAAGGSDEEECQDEDGAITACSESMPFREDELALEVGLNAHDYLEECFYTEVSILDRKKFDAIPEIPKSDLTILGHLGKGNFSDIFEVVCKGGRPVSAKASKAVPGRRRPSWGRRASLSKSITTATLARPTVRGRKKLTFALKCLRPQIRSDAGQFTIGAEDLVHETAILANLDHRHIIKLHGRATGHLRDAFLLNDGYFILLDRLNETLPDRINRWKGNPKHTHLGPTEEQMDVARSVADAMCYLHSKKVIFRDLKPANVGFDSAGTLKLFDFGFATGLPEKDEANPCGFLFDRCGTPRYMAPEVGLSLGYTLPSDVYSLGILLWEMCSLAKPFASIKMPEEFDKYVFMGGERPAMESHWPAAVREVMNDCWCAAPGKRPTMPEVKSALTSARMNSVGENKAPVSLLVPHDAAVFSFDG